MFRSRGGGSERDNRIAICAWHHLHGIHRGIVRAWGIAPDAVRWEIGIGPAPLPPLLQTVGERYVTGA